MYGAFIVVIFISWLWSLVKGLSAAGPLQNLQVLWVQGSLSNPESGLQTDPPAPS